MNKKYCLICGTPFIPEHPANKYCSKKCKQIAVKEQKLEWVNKNRDKVNAKNKIWRKKHPEYHKRYRKEHKDKYILYSVKHRQKKRELRDCMAKHNNCFNCPTENGECLFN